MSFADRVRDIVKQIPMGETRTYGEVAAAAGHPGAARAVGTIMKNNFDESVPCHRVVRRDGLGEYNRGGTATKRKLIEAEKVGHSVS